ncbi:MAG: 6-phosphogluconolactonase [Paracoccaceae bacterium]
MKFVEYPDRDLLMMGLADQLASDLRMALQTGGRATFSVPGGTTPGPVFDILSGLPLDWDRITVLLNDERWVPESSDRSNARLLRQRLLRGRAGAAQFLPLYAAADRPEDVLDRVSAVVEPHLPISVLLLGMGADMHTASLFPGADRLGDALAPDAPALMALRSAAAGEPRITLSARVLSAAMATHILITGAEKRAALERAKGLAPMEAPVQVVLANATVHWAA